MFCNTMVPTDTRLLSRTYDGPKMDMARRRSVVSAPRDLVGVASQTLGSATLNRSLEAQPVLKEHHRRATNASLHERSRSTREDVVALRHQERSATLGVNRQPMIISCADRLHFF